MYVRPETKAERISNHAGPLPNPQPICNLVLPTIVDEIDVEYTKSKLMIDALATFLSLEKKCLVVEESEKKKTIGFKMLDLRAHRLVAPTGTDYAIRHATVLELIKNLRNKITECIIRAPPSNEIEKNKKKQKASILWNSTNKRRKLCCVEWCSNRANTMVPYLPSELPAKAADWRIKKRQKTKFVRREILERLGVGRSATGDIRYCDAHGSVEIIKQIMWERQKVDSNGTPMIDANRKPIIEKNTSITRSWHRSSSRPAPTSQLQAPMVWERPVGTSSIWNARQG
jgi:hypothetical protein